MRPLVLLLLALQPALAASPAQLAPPPEAAAYAAAVRRAFEELEPIAAGQIPGLEPGLLRLRALDPEDEDEVSALAPMRRELEARGWRAERLRALRVDAAAEDSTIRDFSEAYRAGRRQARAFSQESAELIGRTRPRTAAMEFFAATKARLDAMAQLYGDEAVREGARALDSKLRRIADGDWGPDDAIAAMALLF